MSEEILQDIQTLQFYDIAIAQNMLKEFINGQFSFNVIDVELRPQVTSLNSFNGFLILDNGERLFFKSHTESDTIINEYYQSSILADAGYPVIQPRYSSTRTGSQILIYDVIDAPSVFDIAMRLEYQHDQRWYELLASAQAAADDHLLQIYLQSLHWQQITSVKKSAIHQLFGHRLTGGRLERFYEIGKGKSEDTIYLPDGETSMSILRKVRWRINGSLYEATLDDIIERAIQLLSGYQAGPAISGHGDAHNGNVFFQVNREKASLLYFDPAFAGNHHPLLDLAKPIYHNVFARWMYYPRDVEEKIDIRLHRGKCVWELEHNYQIGVVREMFLFSKVERVLIPILKEIKRRGWLIDNWRAFLKASLFCCPFLTMNLADHRRFPPVTALLGFSMAIEMGAESACVKSNVDTVLDLVEAELD